MSAHKVNFGEENSPAAPAWILTHNLSVTTLALLPTSFPATLEEGDDDQVSQDSLVVRAPDSWPKGCEFKSWQKQQNFLLQS